MNAIFSGGTLNNQSPNFSERGKLITVLIGFISRSAGVK